MSKRQAAAVLGVLVLGGVVLLSTLAAAGGADHFKGSRFKEFHRGYFAKLQAFFRHGCWEQSKMEPGPSVPREDFLDACLFVVRVLKPLTPTQVLTNTDLDEVREAFLEALEKETPGLRRHSTCDECVQAVADLEAILATNSTATDTEAALAEGCDDRFFHHPAKAAECRELVGRTPFLIDFFLAELPPVTACEELKFCKVPPP